MNPFEKILEDHVRKNNFFKNSDDLRDAGVDDISLKDTDNPVLERTFPKNILKRHIELNSEGIILEKIKNLIRV